MSKWLSFFISVIIDWWIICRWCPRTIKWSAYHSSGKWCLSESPYVKGVMRIFVRYIFLLVCAFVRTDWRFMCLYLQKAERKFVIGLLSLTRNVKRAIQIHQELSHSRLNPAELLTGSFNGIKVCNFLPPFIFLLIYFFVICLCMKGVHQWLRSCTIHKHFYTIRWISPIIFIIHRLLYAESCPSSSSQPPAIFYYILSFLPSVTVPLFSVFLWIMGFYSLHFHFSYNTAIWVLGVDRFFFYNLIRSYREKILNGQTGWFKAQLGHQMVHPVRLDCPRLTRSNRTVHS
jgi:hypothetical protein